MVRPRFSTGRRAGAHTLSLVALLALVSLVLAACAGAAGPAAGPDDADPGEVPAGAPAATPGAPARADGELLDGAYIIRTGQLSLEVTDLSAAVDAGRRTVAGLGGHVAAAEEQHSASGGWAAVTYRIPAERWEDALASLRGLGRLTELTVESADVSGQVVDLDAQLANLRTTEAAFQAIMERASTIPDVLEVQAELTAVRDRIERLAAQRQSLAERAAMATLTVSYTTPTVASAREVQAWDAGHELESAVSALVALLQRLSSVAIWLGIVVLPVLGPPVLIGYLVYRLVRARQIRATMQPSDPRR